MENRSKHIHGSWRGAAVVLLVLGVCPVILAQQQFEEIAVGFEIPLLTDQDMVVQYDGEAIFVPVIELFTRLGINVEANYERQTFSGKFYTDNKDYVINLKEREAECFGYTTRLNPEEFNLGDLDLYLRIDLFKKIFDLDLQFSFSSLKVTLRLDTDFPAYQKMKRESAHDQLKGKKGDQKNYRQLGMRRSYINGAALDWMLSTNPIGDNKVHYADLTLGSIFLGGDLAMTGTGNSRTGFQADQMTYRWHYYVNDNNKLTQIDVGNMSSNGAVSRSLKGLSLTNKPQVRRQYFQTIRLNGQLEEGWEVELYVNNQLTDFMVIGSDQEYNFDLDVYYGSSRVMLKMYGPNGEIRTEEKYLSVPHNLIPKKTFEYSFTTGRSQVDTTRQWFGITTADYGLFNKLTLGLSHEVPFGDKEALGSQLGLSMTYQPFGDLSLSSSYAPGYSREATLTFSRPILFSASAGFGKYDPLSPRNLSRRLSSARFSISAPFRFGSNVIAARYSISIDKYNQQDAVNMNYGLNTSLWKFHFSYMGNYKRSVYSSHTIEDLSSKVLFMTSVLRFVRPQFRVDYNHTDHQFTSAAVYLTKRIYGSAQMSLTFSRNMVTEIDQVTVSLDLYNSFARFSSKVSSTRDQTSMSQIQRGSIRYNNVNHSVDFSRDNAVGFGSAVLRPFMDENYNGQVDEGEEYLDDLKIRVDGLAGRPHNTGEKFTYSKLRPYYNYQLQIDPTSLDDPMMRPVYENYEVAFTPNVVTSIEVPLALGSEVSGIVERVTSKGTTGVGGIKLHFYNMSNETITEITTFVSGDFYYLGLLPGRYLVYPDQDQLAKYGYESVPKEKEMLITPAEGGESLEDINFLLRPIGSTDTPTVTE